jgi:hypothetical protein
MHKVATQYAGSDDKDRKGERKDRPQLNQKEHARSATRRRTARQSVEDDTLNGAKPDAQSGDTIRGKR